MASSLLGLKKESLLKLHKYLGSTPFGFKPNKKDLVEVLEKAEDLKDALKELKDVVQTDLQRVVPRFYVQRYHLSGEAMMISSEEAQDLMESSIIVKSNPLDEGRNWLLNLQSIENSRSVTILYMIRDRENFLFIVDRGTGTSETLLDF